jgi:hypothetical protein
VATGDGITFTNDALAALGPPVHHPRPVLSQWNHLDELEPLPVLLGGGLPLYTDFRSGTTVAGAVVGAGAPALALPRRTCGSDSGR